jgi:hypothetical protein
MARGIVAEELTRLGHGPVSVESPGDYLRVADAPSFVVVVYEVADGRIKVEWQSGLDPAGNMVTGQLGVMNLVEICREIHHAIERQRVALGLVEREKEDAERAVTLGIGRLQGEFRLRLNERVEIDGDVDGLRRPRFEVSIADLGEDEARLVLGALEGLGMVHGPAAGGEADRE